MIVIIRKQFSAFLGVFAILRKANISYVVFVCLSVPPYARNNSVPTGQIFMKFDISVVFENLWRKFSFIKA
jgi:hypothetical protein